MGERWALTEEEALDLLTYLLACADTCRFEPAFYGPYRLLKAAEKLAERAAGRAAPEGRAFWEGVREEIGGKAHWRVYDRRAWEAFIQEVAARAVREIAARRSLDGRPA